MSRQHSGNKNLQVKQQYSSVQKYRDENVTPDQRMLMLENNLNRVSLQQDALMPLLQMIEYIPAIQRTDALVKALQKKIEDADGRLQVTERAVERRNKESITLPDRKLSKQVTDLSERVVDLDGQIIKLNRMCDTKMKEESQSILRSIESRSPSNPGLDMRQEFLAEFKNIYREIGGLRNDIEFLVSEDKKRKLTEKVQTMGRGLESQDRAYLINYLEQEQFIEELERYEKENSHRLTYELECSMVDLDKSKSQEDLNSVAERLINIKYQVAAGKKKYLHELKKIDQRFEVLDSIVNSLQKLGPSSQKLSLKVPQLQGKMNSIVQTIQENLEQLGGRIATLDRALSGRQ